MGASVLESTLRSLKGGRCSRSAHPLCAPELRSQTGRLVPKLRPSLSSQPDFRRQSNELLSFGTTLLAPKNLDLREDHRLAASALHREGFLDQRPYMHNLLLVLHLASSRLPRLRNSLQLVSPLSLP